MKTLGLIGGTSWVSTIDYYRYINQMVNEKLGGVSSAKLFLYSLDMEVLLKFGSANDWKGLAGFLSDVAKKLETAGAEAIVICANTPHIAADIVQQNIKIPLLHIADETAKEIVRHRIKTVGLLGTKITMEHVFFKTRLLRYGIKTLIPAAETDREFIHTTIFSELGKGIFKEETKKKYMEIISKLQSGGAEGVILGCTEIPMLIKPEDCAIKTFDTTLIHAKAAVDFIFS
ncbi:MAG: aspartate/glutamate racemase family protein [Bacteroidetes bacterium]|nr:aspartate/glutamate racemase family protein [Bacteroidota bacterium]